jgi:capsular polysaccharide biosynthesis protein
VPADPERVKVSRRAQRLSGTWLYAGHWSTHFGHFLLETLPNLWPDPGEYAAGLSGVIAHRQIRGAVPPGADRVRLHRPDLPTWQQQLMDLVGYGAADVHVVHGHAARVERLVVPARPVVLKRRAGPAAVQVWRRVSDAVGARGSQSRVYLSRSRFHAGDPGPGRARTDEAEDARLDEVFAEAGFHVVHPETLPITEQIELVRGAKVLAGLSGSALHLSAFAEPGTRVLTVEDRRELGKPMPAQTMLDEACGHRSLFVAGGDDEGLGRTLAELG